MGTLYARGEQCCFQAIPYRPRPFVTCAKGAPDNFGHQDENDIMNHITQILANCKVSNRSSSPPYREALSTNEEVTPEFHTRPNSWGSKVLSKVKEYRNAIKDMVFDRTPDSTGLFKKTLTRSNFSKVSRNLSPFVRRERLSTSSSVPDIITSAKLAEISLKNESLRTPSSNWNISRGDHHNISTSLGNKRRTANPLKYFSVNGSTSSVQSISPETRQVVREKCSGAQALVECENNIEFPTKNNEIDEGNRTASVRRKISAEPFLSYNGESCEIFWENDSLNCSSPKAKGSSTNDSLNSFLVHEKELKDESIKKQKLEASTNSREKLQDYYESEMSSVRMKISAEPFVSYTKESTEPVWTENLDDSFSSKECALDPLNSSIELLGGPCSSSTFCDDSDIDTNVSLAKASKALEDSGFENNVSALRDNL